MPSYPAASVRRQGISKGIEGYHLVAAFSREFMRGDWKFLDLYYARGVNEAKNAYRIETIELIKISSIGYSSAA